jgi:CDP-diacylglycerol--glycerol-3-phosphate 3-phosphatidyltransferase/archaetidylinositol phosphate synthase
MLGKLRAQYEKLVTPAGSSFAKLGITPNMMTAASIAAAAVAAYMYGSQRPIFGAILVILTGILDMFDGAIARATGKTSRFGATLDHVADRYAEFLIMIGIIAGGYTPWYWGLFTIFGMIMASFTRAKAESVGGLASCTVGIAERQEKLLVLIGASIIDPIVPGVLNYGIIVVGILSHITVAQRLHFTYQQIRGA